MDDSDIRHNPHPKQAYEVTVTVKDVPDAFDAVTAFMSFEVSNSECVPQDPLTGARNIPTHFPKVVLRPLGNGVYSGTAYADLLKDDDYFGLGICHWRFNGLTASLDANGVSFGASILAAQVHAQGSETEYASKELLHGSKVKGLNAHAVAMSDYVAKNPEAFFSITLTARERHDERLME